MFKLFRLTHRRWFLLSVCLIVPLFGATFVAPRSAQADWTNRAGGGFNPLAADTITPTVTVVTVSTNTPTPTLTPTPKPVVTIPATPTFTPTATPTLAPTDTPSATATQKPSPTPTTAPTQVPPTASATRTSSATPTRTFTPTPTSTATATPTSTSTSTPTSTPTDTPTPVPSNTPSSNRPSQKRIIPPTPRPTVPLLPPHDGIADFIIPDSEAVYSPAYANFDIAAFVQQRGGYLARYRESVDGVEISGAQIVQLVSERLSVGPRVLLTLLELEGGWVTASQAGQVANLINDNDAEGSGLYTQLYLAGSYMNAGYYGKLENRVDIIALPDWNRVRLPASINPGTAAVQNLLARQTTYARWLQLMGPDGFKATYQKLFGDPMHYAIEPLVPPDVQQPALRLPWQDRQMWFYTGGPHAGWGDGSPRAAIDIAPPASMGCIVSPDFAIAAAAGHVVASEHARVILNLNGGFQGSGWSLVYMHIADTGRIIKGTDVNTGDRIGHPSCEGGIATGTHLHFARLYNGQWLSADGVLPLNLSGWLFHNLPEEYDGTAARDNATREAASDNAPNLNGITGEPARATPTPDNKLHGDTMGTAIERNSGR